jgi:hypothetical protein
MSVLINKNHSCKGQSQIGSHRPSEKKYAAGPACLGKLSVASEANLPG